MKNILVFAHSREAEYFRSQFGESSNSDIVFICGEGIDRASSGINYCLSKNTKNFAQVFNIGIAGSLNPEYAPIGSIHLISKSITEDDSTCYELNHGPDQNDVCCLSSKTRITNSYDLQKLQGPKHSKAHIVDRELWAIAKTCSLQGIPLCSIKLISDIAGENSDFDYKSMTKRWSKELLEFYLTHRQKLAYT